MFRILLGTVSESNTLPPCARASAGRPSNTAKSVTRDFFFMGLEVGNEAPRNNEQASIAQARGPPNENADHQNEIGPSLAGDGSGQFLESAHPRCFVCWEVGGALSPDCMRQPIPVGGMEPLPHSDHIPPGQRPRLQRKTSAGSSLRVTRISGFASASISTNTTPLASPGTTNPLRPGGTATNPPRPSPRNSWLSPPAKRPTRCSGAKEFCPA